MREPAPGAAGARRDIFLPHLPHYLPPCSTPTRRSRLPPRERRAAGP